MRNKNKASYFCLLKGQQSFQSVVQKKLEVSVDRSTVIPVSTGIQKSLEASTVFLF